jgi:hypothetical protein
VSKRRAARPGQLAVHVVTDPSHAERIAVSRGDWPPFLVSFGNYVPRWLQRIIHAQSNGQGRLVVVLGLVANRTVSSPAALLKPKLVLAQKLTWHADNRDLDLDWIRSRVAKEVRLDKLNPPGKQSKLYGLEQRSLPRVTWAD